MAQRVALLIGNANYANSPLQNPHNDINVLGRSLEKTGFQVWKLRDASAQQMQNALRQLAARARGADAVFFYFSGHGAQHEGQSYLIPTAPAVWSDVDLKYGALALDKVLDSLKSPRDKSRVNLVVVDACRTKIQRSSRNAPRGLAAPGVVAAGTFVAFATAPGTVAYDGKGYTSPYVAELSKAMLLPNLGVEAVFKKARIGVMRRTANQQVPWENSSLTVDFSFKNRGSRPTYTGNAATQPSWCNSSRLNRNEETICRARKLWPLESENVRLYQARKKALSGDIRQLNRLKTRLKSWLRARNACGSDVWCTEQQYKARLQELRY